MSLLRLPRIPVKPHRLAILHKKQDEMRKGAEILKRQMDEDDKKNIDKILKLFDRVPQLLITDEITITKINSATSEMFGPHGKSHSKTPGKTRGKTRTKTLTKTRGNNKFIIVILLVLFGLFVRIVGAALDPVKIAESVCPDTLPVGVQLECMKNKAPSVVAQHVALDAASGNVEEEREEIIKRENELSKLIDDAQRAERDKEHWAIEAMAQAEEREEIENRLNEEITSLFSKIEEKDQTIEFLVKKLNNISDILSKLVLTAKVSGLAVLVLALSLKAYNKLKQIQIQLPQLPLIQDEQNYLPEQQQLLPPPPPSASGGKRKTSKRSRKNKH